MATAAERAAADRPTIAALFSRAVRAVDVVRRTQTADTGKYQYRYVDLSDVIGEVRRVCDAHGLAIVQNIASTDQQVTVTTMLFSDDGQELEFAPVGMPLPRDPQALGSVVTYLRRYALVSLFAMPVEDDDGKTAAAQARHEDQTGFRSGAEQRIHELFAAHDPDVGREVRAKFRDHFGMGLKDLPVSRHGDALTFVTEALAATAADPSPTAGE